MQKLILFILMLIIGLAVNTATANITKPQTHPTMKVATIEQMYQQDVSNQGQDYPVLLMQYGNKGLQAAM